MSESGTLSTSWLLCRIAAERFALPLDAVSEIIEDPVISAVPAAGAEVLGMIAVRGGRRPVHDPARVLGIAAARPVGVVLAVSVAGSSVALAMDAATDTLEIEEHHLQALPALDDPWRVVTGVARDDEGLITVLDAARLVRALGNAEAVVE